MRRLAFCFDGSWNGLKSNKKPTNVQLLAESIKPVDSDDGTVQIVYYDEGVGTQSDEIWRGGVFGKGLLENLREAYRFLIFNYSPGDEIFIFGFSRGGFTAMAFAGLIRSISILPANNANKIDEGFDKYQRCAKSDGVDSEELRDFRWSNCPQYAVNAEEISWRMENVPNFDENDAELINIKYLGVWDSVGSLGFRVGMTIFSKATEQVYNRYLTDLDKTVLSARHAVSIDERRKVFKPTLWHNIDKLNGPITQSEFDDPRPFQQKWFPGDHGSVGGGGDYDGLSRGTLQWIAEGAAKEGLAIDVKGRSKLAKLKYDISTPRHNSYMSNFAKFKSAFKAILLSSDRGKPQSVGELSYPALRMMLADPSGLDGGKTYLPENLKHLSSSVEELRQRFEPQGIDNQNDWEEYIVQEGDNLSQIAQGRLNSTEDYMKIFNANRDKLGRVDKIFQP